MHGPQDHVESNSYVHLVYAKGTLRRDLTRIEGLRDLRAE